MNIDKRPPRRRTVPTDAGVLARSYPSGTRIGLHVHAEAQLLFASRGIMQVTTPKGRWFVPPERAVWLPPRLEHSVDVLADIEMRSLLVTRTRLAAHPEAKRLSREFVVVVGPLLREAILASFESNGHPRLRGLLADLALYRLPEAREQGSFIPMPLEPRARSVAERVLARPGENAELSELARRAGASIRTITRLFPAETGLTFKAWRQRARIMLSLQALGDADTSIKQVAARLGFSSVAAFSYAFRQVTNLQPSAIARAARSQPAEASVRGAVRARRKSRAR